MTGSADETRLLLSACQYQMQPAQYAPEEAELGQQQFPERNSSLPATQLGPARTQPSLHQSKYRGASAGVQQQTWTAGGAVICRVSTSSEGSLSGTSSSKLRPIKMATKLTAIGSPLPICMHRL